jgi:hypothetical protein
MGAVAVFLLVIVLIVAGAIGMLLFGTGSVLRRKKLDPEEDKIEVPPEGELRRPEHLRVENEQKARFAPDR